MRRRIVKGLNVRNLRNRLKIIFFTRSLNCYSYKNLGFQGIWKFKNIILFSVRLKQYPRSQYFKGGLYVFRRKYSLLFNFGAHLTQHIQGYCLLSNDCFSMHCFYIMFMKRFSFNQANPGTRHDNGGEQQQAPEVIKKTLSCWYCQKISCTMKNLFSSSLLSHGTVNIRLSPYQASLDSLVRLHFGVQNLCFALRVFHV